jgi:uncharacterized protein (DUF433 family)
MIPLPPTEPLPLATNEQGVILVGGTRVTLDTVVGAYLDGASPEEIVMQYDALRLADVHRALAYYLDHQSEVEAYLLSRAGAAADARAQFASPTRQADLRQRLLTRRNLQQGSS